MGLSLWNGWGRRFTSKLWGLKHKIQEDQRHTGTPGLLVPNSTIILVPWPEKNYHEGNNYCKSVCSMALRWGSTLLMQSSPPKMASDSSHVWLSSANAVRNFCLLCQVLGFANKTNFSGIFDHFPCLFSEYGYRYRYRYRHIDIYIKHSYSIFIYRH